jgi:hypothetical protein
MTYEVPGHVTAALSFRAKLPDKLQAVVHTPETHWGVPPLAAQTRPHMPQLPMVLSEVSHPLRTLPSHSPQPLLHTGTQALAEQLVVPCALLQAAPHIPQFGVLVASSVSQPSAGKVSQSS